MKRLQLIILGAIASFAFPPYNLWFLIVLFLFPIRFAFNTSSSIKAFQAGFLFALGLFFSGIFWIYISLNSYSNVNIFISLGSVLLLSAYLSLFYGVANASLTFIRNRAHPLYLALGVAIVFSFAELIKGSILGGFNWFTVYHSQLYGPFRGLFPLFGGSGVSFLILYTIGLFAVFPEINEKKRKKILVQMIMGFIVSFLFFEFHWTTSSPTGYQFSLVQGGFTQDQRLNPRFQQLMQNFYFTEVSDEISESDIVILPEGSFINSNAIRSLTPIDGKMIITGALEVNSNGNAFNSIFAIGDEIQSYQKRFLVPFGEFIPGEQIFESSLKALRLPIPRITPGEILQQPLIFKDILIGPSMF
jgi:apolipoprotein N-acyltransferase